MFDFPIGLLTDILLWISGKTGLTAQVVGIIGTLIVLPVLGWITKKVDFAGYEKALDKLLEAWDNDLYKHYPKYLPSFDEFLHEHGRDTFF